MGAHKGRQRQRALGAAHHHGPARGQTHQVLPGQEVEGHHPGVVHGTVVRCAQQDVEEPAALDRGADGPSELVEDLDPGVEVARAVVGMGHGHRRSRRRGDQVDLLHQSPQRPLQDDHGEGAGARRDVAGARAHRVGGHHAGAGVALGRTQRHPGTQHAGGVEQGRAGDGQRAGILTGDGDSRQDVDQGPWHIHRFVEGGDHPGVEGAAVRPYGEDARGLPHAQNVATRQTVVDVARQSCDAGDARHVLLAADDGVVEMGHRPALGDVEPEQPRQDRRGLLGEGVAPGAEGGQQLAVGIQGDVAVHHRGDADGPDRGQLDGVPVPQVAGEPDVGGPQPRDDVVDGVGPHAVDQVVGPLVGAGGDDGMGPVDEDGLDAGRAELDAQRGPAQIQGDGLRWCRGGRGHPNPAPLLLGVAAPSPRPAGADQSAATTSEADASPMPHPT